MTNRTPGGTATDRSSGSAKQPAEKPPLKDSRHEPISATRRRRGGLAALVIAASLVVGCAAPRIQGDTSVAALSALLASGDLIAADALIIRHPDALDVRRALDAAIRGGHIAAVRHYLPKAGVDAPLDLDGTTPLIRAVVDGPPHSRSALVSTMMSAGASPERTDRYGRDARGYAVSRNHLALLALMDGLSVGSDPTPPVSRAAPWFGLGDGPPEAGPASRVSPGVVRGLPADPKPAVRASAASSRTDTAPVRAGAIERGPPRSGRDAGTAGAKPDALEVLSTAMLLRGSPWLPASGTERSGSELAALRFHADGTADVLRHRAGSGRFDPMPRAWGAWRLEAGLLRLAIAGEPFSAWCRGGVALGARLRLDCEERPPLPAPRDGSAGQDLARLQLIALDATDAPPAPPSLYALIFARTPSGDGATDDAVRDPSTMPAAVLVPARSGMVVSMLGIGPSGACTPRRIGPQTPRPAARSFGDWYVLESRRSEVMAPLSDRLCPQIQARDAALKMCRDRSGRDRSACRSIGGCPVGQASALAGMPGVAAGWVGCGPDLEGARRKALEACRTELGCDCQVLALSGRNLNALATDASCTAPTARPR